MCESIGSIPLEEEMPVDFDELKEESKLALAVHNLLRGKPQSYGKDFTNIEAIFNILDINQSIRRFILELTLLIDLEISSQEYNKAKSKEDNDRKCKEYTANSKP